MIAICTLVPLLLVLLLLLLLNALMLRLLLLQLLLLLFFSTPRSREQERHAQGGRVIKVGACFISTG